MSKLIALSKGRDFAIVDDRDFEWLNQWTWALWITRDKRRYARRTVNRRKLKPQYITVLMHRLILGLSDPLMDVDHWDGNGLNNQRANLRTCNDSHNLANQNRNKAGLTSKYKGVHRFRNGTWRAKAAGKYLGTFHSERDAALAYNAAAVVAYGEFAKVNIMEPE